MGIRQKIAEFIDGGELRREVDNLKFAVQQTVDSYLYEPFDPSALVSRLKEYDSAALVDLVHDLEYERIAGTYYIDDTSERRERQVRDSNMMWMNNPLATWTVSVWTSQGLGESVNIITDDENAQPVWSAAAERSGIFDSDKIHELSNWVIVNGNDFIVQFISALDGDSTFGLLDSDEIVDIVKDDSTGKPMYYKRQFTASDGTSKTWHYPNAEMYLSDEWNDIELPSGSVRTDEILDNNTIALIIHIAHNRKSQKSLWGWPILGVAAPYMRSHKEFMENRLTVSRQKASYIREYTTKGGSRAVNSVIAKLNTTLSRTNVNDTNPPAVAGSELVHNEALKMKDLSMNTGASDAKSDNEMFSWGALIGAGLFPTSAGLDTSRWATAVAMDKTQATQWTRYKSFWINNLQRVVKFTLLAKERWGNQSFDGYGATVSIDTLSLVDFPGIVTPVSQMLTSLLPYVENGTVPINATRQILQNVWLLLLQSLGINDADEITSDESFEIETTSQEMQELWGELRKLTQLVERYG